jgi:hypothetical protein
VRLDFEAQQMADRVTVKEIVSSEAEAIAEVERLNALQEGEPCRYVWQATRHMSL